MPDRPRTILLIGSDPGEALRLETALIAGNTVPAAVVQSVTADQAGERVAEDVPDLLFVDLDALGAASIPTITLLRRDAPGVPLIAISRGGEETLAIEALQAGAQDCLGISDTDGMQMLRAVRYAIERSRFQNRQDEVNQQDSRARELGGLNAMSGPAPLPITERSLGSSPLVQRAPQDFDELVRRYGELLDRSLLGRSKRETALLIEDLNDISDRLGMLGAGPRDAVELHKAAMTVRLEGCSARKNKGYVEEGRLLLVQLMGHLVSFYRSLSWGRGPALKTRAASRSDVVPGPGATGKKPQ